MPSFDAAYQALKEYLADLSVVDCHEHLPPESERVKQPVDFSLLFSHYCEAELKSSGMPPDDLAAFYSPKTPLARKWELFAPWYEHIADGGYCRAAHIAMQRFYGYERLTSLADAEAVTTALEAANRPGLYRKVLKEACNLAISMNFGSLEDDPEFFAPVIFVSHFVEATLPVVRQLEKIRGRACGKLDDYVAAVFDQVKYYKQQGARGLKLHLAYMRDLDFEPVTHADAEAVFNRISDEGYGWRYTALGYAESRPLQNYMVHRLCEMAAEFDLPVVIHSALQADNYARALDAKPLPLWRIANRFRTTRFLILHAGLPWLEEAALLAKHFPNVYLDMTWDHIMSSELSVRGLRAFIDLVPRNKIFGFGGDYKVVEKVYGHLQIAKNDLALALAHKVAFEAMPLQRAEGWCKALLHDNPIAFYKLDLA